MTIRQLADAILCGEGQHLEFKMRVPEPTRLAKEVVAFANTTGGRLLLGVEDSGAIKGVKDVAEEEFALEQALQGCCIPVVAISLERIRVSRKRQVIVVTIQESSQKPHFVIDSATGRRTAYVRIDDKSVEASVEAQRLMQLSTSREDVMFAVRKKERQLLQYLERCGKISVKQFAQVAGISRQVASQTLVLLTRANMLEHHSSLEEDYFTVGRQMRHLS